MEALTASDRPAGLAGYGSRGRVAEACRRQRDEQGGKRSGGGAGRSALELSTEDRGDAGLRPSAEQAALSAGTREQGP